MGTIPPNVVSGGAGSSEMGLETQSDPPPSPCHTFVGTKRLGLRWEGLPRRGTELRRRSETCWRGAAAATVLVLRPQPAVAVPAARRAPTPRNDLRAIDEGRVVSIVMPSTTTDRQGGAPRCPVSRSTASDVATNAAVEAPGAPADGVARHRLSTHLSDPCVSGTRSSTAPFFGAMAAPHSAISPVDESDTAGVVSRR